MTKNAYRYRRWLVAVALALHGVDASTDRGLRGLKQYDEMPSPPANDNSNKVAKSECIIQIAALLQIPNEEQLSEDIVFDCELDPTDANGYSGLTRQLSLNDDQKNSMEQMRKEGRLIPGRSKLQIQGVEFNAREVVVPPGFDVRSKVGNAHSNGFFDRRRLATSTKGIKPILVVKVTDVNGLARAESAAQIADDIFGSYGDEVTLKSQLEACSIGQLTIQPGVEAHSDKYKDGVTGVIDVTLDIAITDNDRYAIHNAARVAAQEHLGVGSLTDDYQQVMFVVEKCYVGCGYAAYA